MFDGTTTTFVFQGDACTKKYQTNRVCRGMPEKLGTNHKLLGFPVCYLRARALHQWTDLTSTQWRTNFTDLTSMEQISPHPNGTPQETKSDLANDAIPISTMPLRFAIPEYKTVSCFRCISRSCSQWHTGLINLRSIDMNSKRPSWICEGYAVWSWHSTKRCIH